ncbi:MAG TPA: sensor histidine kinase [Tepidisphaeraceae bacterium]|nr:sensor histidine kinase [Tepidisphaeraceae bacterium]
MMPQNPPLPLIRRSWAVRYALPICSVAAAVSLRLLLENVLKSFKTETTPFLLLFASVLISSGYGGLGPGLAATLLGAFANDFFFTGPRFTLGPYDFDSVVQMLLFVMEGLFIGILGARLQSARRRSEQSEAEARRLERKVLDISDQERRRIGQDLHDGLGQHLTGVAFLSKALQERLSGQSLPEAKDATKIASLVSESIGQTRALARGLSPVVLEEGGLSFALSQLVASTASVFKIRCVYSGDEQYEIEDLTVATHLYRIAQEAINNAIRHGKAKRIDVRLSPNDGLLKLEIEDDGVGISPKYKSDGLGLQIMHFRAKMIGGSLTVSAKPGGGTLVACSTPRRTVEQENK